MTFANQSIVGMLSKGFEYDFWANMKWYSAVRLMKANQEAASAVVQHMLTTQRVWLERCGASIDSISRVASRTSLEEASKAWQQLIASRPLDQKIDYTDSRGRAQSRELGEIAWQVINHGTFHRGHLRGLAQAEGFEEFADTDIILFFDDLRKN